MKKIAVALIATLALVGISTNSAPVLATATPPLSLLSPSSGVMLSGPATVSFQLGAQHSPFSVRITITHASLANTHRLFSIANASITVNQSFSGTIDLLDDQSTLLSSPMFAGITTTIANAVNTSDRMPAGRYTVTVSYQDLSNNPAASSSATNVGLDACSEGLFSSTNNGFIPLSGSCSRANPGHFVSAIGATAEIECPAGRYQANMGMTSCSEAPAGSFVPLAQATQPTQCLPGTFQPDIGQTTCIQAFAGYFVEQAGATSQQECVPGTYQPSVASSSCIRASLGSFVSGSRASSQTTCATGTTSSILGSTVCTPIPMTQAEPLSVATQPTTTTTSSLLNIKRLGIGKKAKLSSMIKPTRGAKLKWSVSGGCKVRGVYIVAPKKRATCSIALRQTVTKKVGSKKATTTSTSRVSVAVS